MDYATFLTTKRPVVEPTGFTVAPEDIAPHGFLHQRDIVRWGLRLGKAAIFAGVGLGKTWMQLEWARHVTAHTGKPVLIISPLAVAPQTIKEGIKFGIQVDHVIDQMEVERILDHKRERIFITNYDNAHKFNPDAFAGVVLDESSILKHYSKTFFALTNAWKDTPFRLCCTATPAPNDFVEFGNHSMFLGIMHFKDVLARWFVGEGDIARSARLKHHAREDFWRWLTSWAVCISKPADLGYQYDMPGYDLPELHVHEHRLPAPQSSIDRAWSKGMLLPDDSANATSFHTLKRESLSARVDKAVEIVAGVSDIDPIILWCHTDYEADALRKAFPGAIEVRGSQTPKHKEELLTAFSEGKERLIITKPSIAGMGLNWQHCNRAVRIGVDFSFETTYQSMGRIHRYGQTRPVHEHFIYAETEGSIRHILKQKQDAFVAMQSEMRTAMQRHGLFRESAPPTFISATGTQSMIIPHWLRSKAG